MPGVEERLFEGRELLSWSEAAAYLGPSFTARWVKRQVYEFRTIGSLRLGGRRVIPKSELDRFVRESEDDIVVS